MATVGKTDLREHFKTKIGNLVADQRVAMSNLINDRINPIIDSLVDTSGIQRRAIYILEGMEKITTLFPSVENMYEFRYGRREFRRINNGGFENTLKGHIRTTIQTLIEDTPETFLRNMPTEELNKAVEDLIEEVKPYKSTIEDLNKLKSEINAVIDSSHNGSIAQKRLLELGIDMSDFQKQPTTALAVVQLSVDPCLINGGCK